MIYLVLLLAAVAGILLLFKISPAFHPAVYLGLGYLVGLGLTTFGIFLVGAAGLTINSGAVVLVLVALLGVMATITKIYKPQQYNTLLAIFKPKLPSVWAWYGLAAIGAYVIYGIYSKSVFWPVFDYDSCTGFNFYGLMVATEGTFDVSFFDWIDRQRTISRMVYPPFVALGSTLCYLFDATPKLMPPLQYLFFAIGFYGLLRKHTTALGAMLFTLGLILTPEMLAHAALVKTNMPNTAFAGPGLIAAALYLRHRQCKYLLLAAVLLGLNTWVRTDGIAFVMAVVAAMVLDMLLPKPNIGRKWWPTLQLLGIAIVPFLAWNVFIKAGLEASSANYISLVPAYNPQKIDIVLKYLNEYFFFGFGLLGASIFLFWVMLVANAKNIYKNGNWLVVITFLTWLIYTVLMYQAGWVTTANGEPSNPGLDSMEVLMSQSYKRAMFLFVPLTLYFVATNKWTNMFLNRIEKYLNPQTDASRLPERF